MSSEATLQPTAKKNIETIAQVEKQLLRQRPRLERVGETIARFFGSLYFIVAHVLFIVGWVLVNTGFIANVPPFDPYPFAFLSSAVGVEFIFLTTFVLMNQNQQIHRSEQWAHLHLQLSMLTEQEVTKNMRMLHRIGQHLGLEQLPEDRQEVKEMTQATPVSALVDEIGKFRQLGQELANEMHAEAEQNTSNKATAGGKHQPRRLRTAHLS